MNPSEKREAFRGLAKTLDNIDLEIYEKFGKDPLDPIIGEGDERARIAIFGRDPGREEVRHGQPFIGAGGQKVRAAMYRVLFGLDLPDFQASIEVGRHVFWANTVPYKPMGNKVWPIKVQTAFKPLMAAVLLEFWQGDQIITLGRDAFFWFGIGCGKAEQAELERHWARPDRFETSTSALLTSRDGQRRVHLHPLPHPSPLNATWYSRFPGLLERCLEKLSLTPSNWRLE